MEGMDEKFIDELKEKSIERSDDLEITDNTIDEELTADEPASEPLKEVKKSKKVRSEKQKAAFEKARIKRAENLKIKKQIEAEKKEQKKKEKELVKAEVKERLEHPDYPQLQPQSSAQLAKIIGREGRDNWREQVVNNYYYYSGPPPDAPTTPSPPPPRKSKKKKRQARPPTPETDSSSESESEVSEIDEPDTYRELQNYEEDLAREGLVQPEPEEPKFKFSFR